MNAAARLDSSPRYGSAANDSNFAQDVAGEPHGWSERRCWLFSRSADFWLACGGASVGLLAAVLVILWHGDRELDGLDFVLSEFHLGATYDAVVRRRLWHHRRVDVVAVPLLILALTYALSMSGQAVLLTSIAMYAAVWHRGRQSLGVGRFYQRGMGGLVSRTHDLLFRGAIYLPMVAGLLAYTHLAPLEYEGKPYVAMNFGAPVCFVGAFAAVLWVIAYVVWAIWRNHGAHQTTAPHTAASFVHPGEWWVVLANAVAFGSGYYLGASNASFLLVLAVHHEVQYLYFTYAMARHPRSFYAVSKTGTDPAMKDFESKDSHNAGRALRTEIKFAASFLRWPVIGFAGAIVGGWSELAWLAPLGVGGLLCHYWFDSRIWTRRGTGIP
jgi:hypothetical protein